MTNTYPNNLKMCGVLTVAGSAGVWKGPQSPLCQRGSAWVTVAFCNEPFPDIGGSGIWAVLAGGS